MSLPHETGAVVMRHAWKKFRYGEVHQHLRDALPALARRLVGRRDADEGLWTGEFWALRDVSFTVGPGEALGIIGPNGAGKSTILKLVTRILRPTSGSCAVSGRIGALIEVGAGFHPDLTGRENLMLQGVIMGMPRREVARKFDQIVEFSGIAPFIDTPVKRYSSGMHARLGFAIAAHLDPDVLIIDEALSVGDAEFQRRALERVRELLDAGIPTLVVSHQLDVIASLCTHALLLDRGSVIAQGDPRSCIAAYLDGTSGAREASAGDGAVRVERMTLDSIRVESGGSIGVMLGCSVRDDGWVEPESVRLRLRAAHTGDLLFETGTDLLETELPRAGAFDLSITLQLNVPPGVYIVEAFAWDRIMSRMSFIGPTAHVEVAGGSEFVGTVQLNAQARLDVVSRDTLRAVEGSR